MAFGYGTFMGIGAAIGGVMEGMKEDGNIIAGALTGAALGGAAKYGSLLKRGFSTAGKLNKGASALDKLGFGAKFANRASVRSGKAFGNTISNAYNKIIGLGGGKGTVAAKAAVQQEVPKAIAKPAPDIARLKSLSAEANARADVAMKASSSRAAAGGTGKQKWGGNSRPSNPYTRRAMNAEAKKRAKASRIASTNPNLHLAQDFLIH